MAYVGGSFFSFRLLSVSVGRIHSHTQGELGVPLCPVVSVCVGGGYFANMLLGSNATERSDKAAVVCSRRARRRLMRTDWRRPQSMKNGAADELICVRRPDTGGNASPRLSLNVRL